MHFYLKKISRYKLQKLISYIFIDISYYKRKLTYKVRTKSVIRAIKTLKCGIHGIIHDEEVKVPCKRYF